MSPAISVIVRSKDRAHTIREALLSVRAQDHEAELIVVDSGSTDGTLDIAREHADRVIEIRPEDFTYGGALNIGAAAAAGDVHVALSAHCTLPDPGWLSRVLAHHEDPTVAATTGLQYGPLGRRLLAPYRQEGSPSADPNPYWGYSNHAGSWRADVWQRQPFSERLVACEDKEWANRVRLQGGAIIVDPTLFVTATHRRREGGRALFDRAVREAQAVQSITGKPPLTLRDAAHELIARRPEGRPAVVQLVNPYKMTELIGRYVGERRAVRA